MPKLSPKILPSEILANPLTNKPEETVPVAALLIMAAGTLDAFTYVGHGGVFANAMTGNVVLLAIHLGLRQWPQVLPFVVPIVAYLSGVVVAHALKEPPLRRLIPHPARASLILEVAFLIAVAVWPKGVPDMAVVAGIAFVAAIQGTTFTRIEGFAYTSVTTTGNLRHFAESLLQAVLFRRDAKSWREARFFLTVCACFFGGALLGGCATERFGNPAVWLSIVLLSAALGLCLPWNKPLHAIFERNRT